MACKVHIVFFSIISILLFNCSILFSQSKDIRFEHLTVEDGLPTNTIWDITQDHLGFMWFTTSNGLVKYDGYKFTTYQPDDNDSNSIYIGNLNLPYEDRSQNLWITHYNGMSLYNRETGNFTNYLIDPDADGTYNNVFWHIIEDHTGTLWVGTGAKGLLKLVKNFEKLRSNNDIIEKSYVHNPEDSTSIVSNCVWTLYEDKSGILWLATDKGLCKYNRKTDNFTTYKTNKEEYYFNRMYSILEDSKNNFWIGTLGGGLAKFDRNRCEFEFTSFTGKKVYSLVLPSEINDANRLQKSIVEDYDGTFWIPTYGAGLINFNPVSKQFNIFIHDPTNPHSLGSGGDYAQSIYRDHSNVYWASSTGAGLNKFSKDKQFRHIICKKSEQGFSNRIVSYIYEDKEGIMWIGTGGGFLNKFNQSTGEFTHFPIITDKDNSIGNDYIRCIYEDSDGILWIGMHRAGLYKFDKATEKFTCIIPYHIDASGRINMSITSIFEDESGRLWIGSRDGLKSTASKDLGEFSHHRKFKSQSGGGDSISTRDIYDMYLDNDGIIWFVNSFGILNSFNAETNQGKRYRFDRFTGEATLFSIYGDKKNRIWIGRDAGGLLCFDKKSESYKIYRIRDGLPDETVGAVLEDDKGYLWMRTGTSICRFDPDDETFKVVYKLSQGFQKFNCWRAWKSKLTGEMFFPGDDGFYIFHPDSIKGNLIPPKIVLTDFQIFDESVQIGKDSPLKRNINIANEVVLEHWQNDFSIEFAALHYTNPAGNQHKYKLSGYEEDWRIASAIRLAKYTNMSPGEYTFQVIGSNSDGIWNEEGASLKIIILPPWWATTRAYVIYAIIILSIVYFTWKLQLKRIRIKHDYEMSKFEAAKMHEVDEMKSRFFANISHEFRTPLTLIFGPAKDVIEETNEPSTKRKVGIIKRNASRLYSLVNQLLDLSKLEAGKMKLEASEQNIIRLLKGYFLSFTSLAERKKIILKFNSLEDSLNVYVDKDKLEKIINNLLSNAFKFTPEGGKIDFTVVKLDSYAEIRVADSGMGIAEERLDKIFDRFYQVDGSQTRESEGTGIGLALTKELVELHKGKIEVESQYGKGTTFKVLLPLGKDHLKPDEIVERELSEEIQVTTEEAKIIPEVEKLKGRSDIEVLLESNKPLLLIVEDNSDVRNYIVSHLEEDYRLQEAVDGEDGHNQAIKNIPDLIISDVMMPKMDGFELCQKLKTDERTSHIPVILLTAKATDKDKITGYETGADDYIMKPFDSSVLKVRIKNLIEQRRKLREQFRKEGIIELEEKDITSTDKKFLQNVIKIINNHLSDTVFTVKILADEVSMSRSNLERKLAALTGESPAEIIKKIRLTRASKLIIEKSGNISEIALEVGFSNPAYFSKCFREQFGFTPSEYKTNHS